MNPGDLMQSTRFIDTTNRGATAPARHLGTTVSVCGQVLLAVLCALSVSACAQLEDAVGNGLDAVNPANLLTREIDAFIQGTSVRIDTQSQSFLRDGEGNVTPLDVAPFGFEGLSCDIVSLASIRGGVVSRTSTGPLASVVGYPFAGESSGIVCTSTFGLPDLEVQLRSFQVELRAAYCTVPRAGGDIIQARITDFQLANIDLVTELCGTSPLLCDDLNVTEGLNRSLAPYLQRELERGLNQALAEQGSIRDQLGGLGAAALGQIAPAC